MTETISVPLERPRRLRLDWIAPALFHPRQAFATIAAQSGGVWLTPLLLLTLTAVAAVLVAGPLKKQAALNSPPELPPNFEYYSPEDQAQFMQALQATQSDLLLRLPGPDRLRPRLGWLAGRLWAGLPGADRARRPGRDRLGPQPGRLGQPPIRRA
jgi:hypothetical protein